MFPNFTTLKVQSSQKNVKPQVAPGLTTAEPFTDNMSSLKIYTDDLQTAQAIMQRDERQTRDFMYVRCYPLFKSIFDNYYTDCETVQEFITEIYVLLLTPGKETGRCQLQNYRGESTLATWMKTACLFHCYHRFKKRMVQVDFEPSDDEEDAHAADRFLDRVNSTPIDTGSLDRSDVETLLRLMPNERYRNLIRLRYVEEKSHEETARELGMTLANYYNKHKLAKAQFVRILNKEAHHAN